MICFWIFLQIGTIVSARKIISTVTKESFVILVGKISKVVMMLLTFMAHQVQLVSNSDIKVSIHSGLLKFMYCIFN